MNQWNEEFGSYTWGNRDFSKGGRAPKRNQLKHEDVEIAEQVHGNEKGRWKDINGVVIAIWKGCTRTRPSWQESSIW